MRAEERRWVLLRHAPARSRDLVRWPDDHDRGLRPSGRREFREAAEGLGRLLDRRGRLATSSLARAVETSELLGEVWRPGRSPEVWEELRPEASLRELFDRARTCAARGDLVLVGHEPELSTFVGYCLVGQGTPVVKFARGGAVAIGFPGAVRPGGGRLLWALTRSQLRRMGARKRDRRPVAAQPSSRRRSRGTGSRGGGRRARSG